MIFLSFVAQNPYNLCHPPNALTPLNVNHVVQGLAMLARTVRWGSSMPAIMTQVAKRVSDWAAELAWMVESVP
jgi:hypothetical protein